MTDPALTEAQKQKVREAVAIKYETAGMGLAAEQVRAGNLDGADFLQFALIGAAAVNKQRQLQDVKNALDCRLNDVLCEMKPGWDDSMVGFNEAWDIVRQYMKERLAVEG